MTLFQKIKPLWVLSITILVLLSFGCSPYSSEDEKVMELLDFDPMVFEKVRERSNAPFTTYYNYVGALSIQDTFTIIRDIVFDLKADLFDRGYLIFISYEDLKWGHDQLMVIPKTELGEMEILRFRETGPNVTVSKQAVIDQVTAWNEEYGVWIIGADHDWMEIQFMDIPAVPMKVVKEAYEIYPAIIGPDSEGVTALLEKINKREGLYFQWESFLKGRSK